MKSRAMKFVAKKPAGAARKPAGAVKSGGLMKKPVGAKTVNPLP